MVALNTTARTSRWAKTFRQTLLASGNCEKEKLLALCSMSKANLAPRTTRLNKPFS
jgi:hypothetical protein